MALQQIDSPGFRYRTDLDAFGGERQRGCKQDLMPRGGNWSEKGGEEEASNSKKLNFFAAG